MVEAEPREVCRKTRLRRSDSKISKASDAESSSDRRALNRRYNGGFAAEEVKGSVVQVSGGAICVAGDYFTASTAIVVELGPGAEILSFRT
jgi:hypothetical protein